MPSRSQSHQGGNRVAFTTPAMLGGPAERNPDILTLRWLGTANYELTIGGRVILLDCFYDRGPRGRPLGFGPEDVVRADEIFIGHPHYDHISDAASVASLRLPKLQPARDAVSAKVDARAAAWMRTMKLPPSPRIAPQSRFADVSSETSI